MVGEVAKLRLHQRMNTYWLPVVTSNVIERSLAPLNLGSEVETDILAVDEPQKSNDVCTKEVPLKPAKEEVMKHKQVHRP